MELVMPKTQPPQIPSPPPKKNTNHCAIGYSNFDQSFQQCYCGWGNKGKMPGSWNTGNAQEKMSVWGVSNPSQTLPVLRPLKSSSRYPAATEETCSKSIPYSDKAWHSWVRWLTEWENYVFTLTVYYHVQMTSYTLHLYSVNMCV